MIVRELLTRLGFSIDSAKAKQAEVTIEGIKGKADALVGTVMRVGAVIGLAFSADKIIEAADAWTSVEARVSLVTNSAKEQEQVLKNIYNIAQDTRQEFTATADLYTKMSRGSEELGMNQKGILKLTETINKALVVGGGEAQENKAAILQLGQALSSGKLQGDELRSILENSPRLSRAIADGLGVGVGKLRELGADGELTSKQVADAILSQFDKINAEFKKMPLTVGQSVTYSKNAWGRWIDKIGKDTGVFKNIANSVVSMTDKTIGGFNKAADAVGGWDKLFRSIGIGMASIGAGIGAMVFVSKLEKITKTFKILLKVLASPVFWGVALAITAIALVIEDLYTWLNGGESVIGSWLESMGISAEQVKEFFKNAWNFIIEHTKGFTGMLIDVFKKAVEVLGGIIGSVAYALLFAVQAVVDIVKFILSVFTGDWESAIEAIKSYFGHLYDFIANILSSFGVDINTVTEFFKTAWSSAIETVKGFFTSMYTWGVEKLNGLIELINKIPGVELPQVSIGKAGTSGKGSNNVNQSIVVQNSFSGTTSEQAGFLMKTTEKTSKMSFGQLSRGIQL